jgi:hypothetical protein
MAIARAQLVDAAPSRWYHCVTRCVRRAFLLGEGDHNRKQWLQNRLEELAEIFAVSVGGFSVIFFEERFKSVAILDEEALLAIGVYIDLNPVAAKISETPETSDYTSIKRRVDHVEAQGKTAELEAASGGSVAGSQAAGGLEESL